MKKFLLLMVSYAMIAFGNSSSLPLVAHNQSVKFDDLPETAQRFVKKYFPGVAIRQCSIGKKRNFDLKLVNGYEIGFDREGNWTGIESDKHPFSPELLEELPGESVTYLNMQFPRTPIHKMEHKGSKYRVWVKSTPKAEISFDEKGKLLKADYKLIKANRPHK